MCFSVAAPALNKQAAGSASPLSAVQRIA